MRADDLALSLVFLLHIHQMSASIVWVNISSVGRLLLLVVFASIDYAGRITVSEVQLVLF